jgi:hypothetical protein
MADSTLKKILNPVDARSTRGIFSRGYARYGVSQAPKPGSLKKAAKRRLQKIQKDRRG